VRGEGRRRQKRRGGGTEAVSCDRNKIRVTGTKRTGRKKNGGQVGKGKRSPDGQGSIGIREKVIKTIPDRCEIGLVRGQEGERREGGTGKKKESYD